LELREILARQPGPEAAEHLAEFQRCMRSKTKQVTKISTQNMGICSSILSSKNVFVENFLAASPIP